jgi:tetratricopeptide (TPR) repeat protein
MSRHTIALAQLAVLTALLPAAVAQQTGPPQGSREAMWPAPSAEDWAKPCLITWQRSYEDALAVSKETGKANLVCVNMDGEIASEHYAGIRYRQPEIAALYEPYVCVIASVYRHTPRDHDLDGNRILCPRFGSVTCGEHISIEPGLFDKFFEGQRVAPRHIGVELDSEEMYDVYYAFDTDTIFNALREGVENRGTVPLPETRSDRPLLDRVASRHSDDQAAVEEAYRAADPATRKALLEAAVESGGASVGLLRLAVFGFDVEASRIARRALAVTENPNSVDLISEALRVPMASEEREALLASLERLGQTSPRARTFATAHRGLASASSTLDVAAWSSSLAAVGRAEVVPDESVLTSWLESAGAESGARPDNAEARLEFAEASLALARAPGTDPKYARLMLLDGHGAALEAEQLGADGWRVHAAIALGAYDLGDIREAYDRAEAAVDEMPPGETSANAAHVLRLFAESRQRSIGRAVRMRREWPAEWITDVHAAYSVLADHPHGTDDHAAMHYDFLRWFGASQTPEILDRALARFPESWVLHDRLRGRVLRERGVAGLEPVYESMLQQVGASPNLQWFAGYASVVAAEFHRRGGDDEAALAAYDRAIAHYEAGAEANPSTTRSAAHYVAMALAGRARMALERGDLAAAKTEILAAFEREPWAAGSLDGLGIQPTATARMLLRRLMESGELEAAAEIQAGLDHLAELDPELVKLPPNERGGLPSPDARRFGGGR